MSAVTRQAPVPHYEEGLAYWDEFTQHCHRHVSAINAVVRENQLSDECGVTWRPGSQGVAMVRNTYPSTEIKLHLVFEHWGPKIAGSVRGYQEEDLRFYPEEFEFTLASDEDDRMVAVTSEGRSLTPHEFAKYVAQNFRRSYPGISLPCPDSPLI